MMMERGGGIGLNIINRMSNLLTEEGGVKVKSILGKGSTFHFLIDCYLQDHRMQDGYSHRSEDFEVISEGEC